MKPLPGIDVDARRIRSALGYTLHEMADFLGVSYHTYRSWEDENPLTRKNMSGAARSLLRVCAARPDVVRSVLNAPPTAAALKPSHKTPAVRGVGRRSEVKVSAKNLQHPS